MARGGSFLELHPRPRRREESILAITHHFLRSSTCLGVRPGTGLPERAPRLGETRSYERSEERQIASSENRKNEGRLRDADIESTGIRARLLLRSQRRNASEKRRQRILQIHPVQRKALSGEHSY